ncbi:MAG TPA: NAD(P)/FAD-dependent oxidoreductase [Vicinamibacteria bacterium]
MRPSSSRDVVVVGGGPAGAATALLLRRRGYDVLLVDEAHFPRDKVCGEGVSPEAWRLLDLLGAAGAVRALRPRPLRGMAVVSPDGTTFRGDYAGRAGFALRRHDLDAALLACARQTGVEVRTGAAARRLVLGGGRVEGVVIENGSGPELVRSRLVIGADGRRSLVARTLGLLREHHRLRKFAVRGYWEGMEGLGEHGEMHVGGGGYCGIAPLSATAANVTFVLDRREMLGAGGALEAFYREAIARRWPRVAERVRRATLDGPPRAIGPLALQARRVAFAGGALVGDAAGFYDPFTGEGVTLALRSAELADEAAHRSLKHAAVPGVLWEYEQSRARATADKFRLNRLLQRVVAWPGLANAVARRLARRPDLADQLVGIAGDFVPARGALRAAFVLDLIHG